MTAADPGAVPAAARALAPDLARGAMLLLIALANVHRYVYDVPSEPGGLSVPDAVVVLVETLAVDGRAYPLFGLLFGYGIVQLARRRDRDTGVALARRRGWWMLVIGAAHGVLLWPGDIVGAYGLLAVLLAGMLVRGSEAALFTVLVGGLVLLAALAALPAPVPGSPEGSFPSIMDPDPLTAMAERSGEWVIAGVIGQALAAAGAVALGALAARARLLDEPGRFRGLLVRTAAGGLVLGVLTALPQALRLVGVWAPQVEIAALSGSVHALGGYAGAVGYAALFGLLAIRVDRGSAGPGAAADEPVGASAPGTGPDRMVAPEATAGADDPATGDCLPRTVRALRATGQRSLSCYVAQSVVFVALYPAWTLGLGGTTSMWSAAAVAIVTWLLTVLLAVASARTGRRGPLEVLLRRLTYGRRPRTASPPP